MTFAKTFIFDLQYVSSTLDSNQTSPLKNILRNLLDGSGIVPADRGAPKTAFFCLLVRCISASQCGNASSPLHSAASTHPFSNGQLIPLPLLCFPLESEFLYQAAYRGYDAV